MPSPKSVLFPAPASLQVLRPSLSDLLPFQTRHGEGVALVGLPKQPRRPLRRISRRKQMGLRKPGRGLEPYLPVRTRSIANPHKHRGHLQGLRVLRGKILPLIPEVLADYNPRHLHQKNLHTAWRLRQNAGVSPYEN